LFAQPYACLVLASDVIIGPTSMRIVTWNPVHPGCTKHRIELLQSAPIICLELWSLALSQLGYTTTCSECRWRTLNWNEYLRHLVVSLWQHGSLVMILLRLWRAVDNLLFHVRSQKEPAMIQSQVSLVQKHAHVMTPDVRCTSAKRWSVGNGTAGQLDRDDNRSPADILLTGSLSCVADGCHTAPGYQGTYHFVSLILYVICSTRGCFRCLFCMCSNHLSLSHHGR